MKLGLKTKIIIGLVLIVAGYLVWCWYAPRSPYSVDLFTEAKPALKVKAIIPVKSAPVKTVPKRIVAQKLDLPQSVIDDGRQQVISTADIEPTKGGVTTVTVLDTESGQSRTIVKEKRLPFLSFERSTEVGVRYGMSNKGQQISLYGRRDFLRIGKVYFSGYAEASMVPATGDAEAKAMIEASLRW